MKEKTKCKWYWDEFCTNAECPCCADYCPLNDYPDMCKYYEVEEDADERKQSRD